jgi:hypothetical protein
MGIEPDRRCVVSRHRPAHGADSAEAYVLRPFRVLIEEEMGDRLWFTVNAIGRHDAEHQAKEKAIDKGYFDPTALTVEEAERDYVDAELQKAKDAA